MRTIFASSIAKWRGSSKPGTFGHKIGVPTEAITEWEKGNNVPLLDRAMTIADRLGISLTELAFGRDAAKEEVAKLKIELEQMRILLFEKLGGREDP